MRIIRWVTTLLSQQHGEIHSDSKGLLQEYDGHNYEHRTKLCVTNFVIRNSVRR